MASTPSASALSAVLRCRGNILARNQANKKRPATSGYNLGLVSGAVCDSVRPKRTRSVWKSFFQEQRLEFGNGVFLEYKPAWNTKTRDYESVNYTCQVKISELRICAPGVPRSLNMPNVQNEKLPNVKELKNDITRRNYEKKNWDKIIETSPAVLNVSITWHNKEIEENMIPAFILNGWSTLKNRCFFFTVFASEIMHVKLGVFCRSRPNDVGEAAMEGQTTIRGKSTSVKSIAQQDESLNGQSGSPFD